MRKPKLVDETRGSAEHHDPTRIIVMARLIFAFLALLALPAFAAEKPNIIYVLLDDAGYGDLSCYGQTKFTTPNVDRLASEGLKFTDHYSGSTVCAPTRCVLMTGVHTGQLRRASQKPPRVARSITAQGRIAWLL